VAKLLGIKRGYLLALIGLMLGMAVGFGLLAIKSRIAKELVQLLADEAAEACNCEFKADSIDVSLLTLSAVAKKPRLELDEQVKLEFESLRATFSLKRIRERTFLISKMILRGGLADGVSEESALYRFIDQLTAPVPPERDRPDRWRVKLMRLNVLNTNVIQTVGQSKLQGDGLTLTVQRTLEDNFKLDGRIERLGFSKFDPNSGEFQSQIEFGGLSTSVLLLDDATVFDSVELKRDRSWLTIRARSDLNDDNRLTGDAKFHFDSTSTLLEQFLDFKGSGEAQIGGYFDRPEINASLGLDPDSDLIVLPDHAWVGFQSFSTDFNLNLDPDNFRFGISKLSGGARRRYLALRKPISIGTKEIRGEIFFHSEEAVIGPIELDDSDLRFELSGTLTQPLATISGTFEQVGIGGEGILSPAVLNSRIDLNGAFVELSSNPTVGGAFQARAKVEFGNSDIGERVDTQFVFNRYPIDSRGQVRVAGTVTAKGPLDIGLVHGQGELEVLRDDVRIVSGKVEIDGGVLSSRLQSGSGAGLIESRVDFVREFEGAVKVEFDRFSLSEIDPEVPCTSFTAEGEYLFGLAEPKRGSGAIEISRFGVGCEPYSIEFSEHIVVPIKNGDVEFQRLVLSSSTGLAREGEVTVDGQVSLEDGYGVRVSGSLFLQALAGLMRGVDDLRGEATLDVRVTGALDSPRYVGVLELKDGALSIEAADLDIREVVGRVNLGTEELRFKEFGGRVNGGIFSLGGNIYPHRLGASSFELTVQRALFEPIANASVELSANLNLGPGAGSQEMPRVTGELLIDGAEFSRDIDLRFILEYLTGQIIRRRTQENSPIELPEVELDVRVHAPRNLLFSTNILSVELSADLAISGSTLHPEIDGYIRTLSGWFRIKDRRLEITSGELTFRPGVPEPFLQIIGESYVSSIQGEAALVMVEVRGSIVNPTILLSSDIGLSQREILDLLTHQGTISDQILMNVDRRSLLSELQDPDSSIFDENLITILPRLLMDLARLDSLSVEPTFSPSRGAIDPTLIATRKITNRLELRGESAFAGAGTEASIGAFYQLSPGLTLATRLESSYERNLTSLEADLIYTAFGRHRPFMRIQLVGNRKVDELTLLGGIRIRDSSRLRPEDVSTISAAVDEFYNQRGFFTVSSHVECLESEEFCRALLISVNEGAPSIVRQHLVKIAQNHWNGAAELAEQIVQTEVGRLPKNRQATRRFLERSQQRVIRALRNEGFISARVEARYVKPELDNGTLEDQQPEDRAIEFSIDPGSPITLVFEGNTLFGPTEFLETINLFERKQPFGVNTINILVENIEKLYRRAGYLLADVNYERISDHDAGRVIYQIQIAERKKVIVEGVDIEFSRQGNGDVTVKELHARLAERYPTRARRILRPPALVTDELSDSVRIFTEILVDSGYPAPQLRYDYRFVDEDTNERVRISYSIDLGERIVIDALQVQGFPEELGQPDLPELPIFVPGLNRFIEELLFSLRSSGYQLPQIASELDVSQDGEGSPFRFVTLRVSAGEYTRIGGIHIEGLRSIESEVIMNQLQFETGEHWNQEKIDTTKRALLRLGLFSQVQIEPVSGRLSPGVDEELVIRVTERPLQSVDVGGGLHSEYGVHLFTQATDRVLFGDGRSLSLRLDGYYDPVEQDIPYGVAGLQFVNPAFMFSDYSFASDLRYQKIDLRTQEYDLDRVSLASYFNRSFDSPWTLSFGHTIMHDDLNRVTPGAIISDLDSGSLLTSFVSGALSFDRRNDRLNPSSGYYLGADSKLASEFLGSDSNFYELGARAAYIQPVALMDREFSLAAHVRAASAWTFAGTDEVPITQRYYLGGRTTVRGFRERSLGPRGFDDAIIGGDLSLLANLELRYHPMEALQLLTFLDLGNVYLHDRSVVLSDLRRSTGLGMRYLSPIGPIGFDLGFPLDEKQGEPSMRLHFTIGTQF
jgi:outer membrane protein insertion porin family